MHVICKNKQQFSPCNVVLNSKARYYLSCTYSANTLSSSLVSEVLKNLIEVITMIIDTGFHWHDHTLLSNTLQNGSKSCSLLHYYQRKEDKVIPLETFKVKVK